jgi:hypothetical protein
MTLSWWHHNAHSLNVAQTDASDVSRRTAAKLKRPPSPEQSPRQIRLPRLLKLEGQTDARRAVLVGKPDRPQAMLCLRRCDQQVRPHRDDQSRGEM